MTVLITGANRGIGNALYTTLSARGDKVIGTARNAQGFLPLDVSDPASQQALADEIVGTPLDLLVCNAGVYLDKGQSLADGYPPQMWADMFAVNVTGVFLTVQALLSNLKLAKGAKVAIISSQMASSERAQGGSYIYRASKAAALNLGRNLAEDMSDLGIAVGIYHPGWVRTNMGGSGAAISVDESAAGLVQRFDALSLATTGCFETFDGQAHPY
ncbi:SDR family NAD(P)-dependent oxidoreductase [Puniceibacterium sediminis]|uniref:NADP-dependent 3-hydroxy acid dehydrogenase YdfG n=1 Tax=Puniceibacterium sediminis TaxID=1608407 RepID=A0A238WWY3_9RHOB|nr:SDR family NAD(P)-dependent oxidoreductase [Puniceibacterium sediminis]SNR51006.1 NADP-dependent 3-hydroxy acid dehydrogenase YdfG [Puniceibacterium sediminis]